MVCGKIFELIKNFAKANPANPLSMKMYIKEEGKEIGKTIKKYCKTCEFKSAAEKLCNIGINESTARYIATKHLIEKEKKEDEALACEVGGFCRDNKINKKDLEGGEII